MTTARSTAYFARCIRLAVVAGMLSATLVTLRGERRARACGGWEPEILAFSTFDPGVLGDAALQAVFYDPYVSRFGGYQPAFGQDALLADWHGYLGGAVSDADWRKILFEADVHDLATFAPLRKEPPPS
jgi:hypothetical protein